MDIIWFFGIPPTQSVEFTINKFVTRCAITNCTLFKWLIACPPNLFLVIHSAFSFLQPRWPSNDAIIVCLSYVILRIWGKTESAFFFRCNDPKPSQAMLRLSHGAPWHIQLQLNRIIQGFSIYFFLVFYKMPSALSVICVCSHCDWFIIIQSSA